MFVLKVCAQVSSLCVLTLCFCLCSSLSPGFDNNHRFPCAFARCGLIRILVNMGNSSNYYLVNS
jgi:hypothetical protein